MTAESVSSGDSGVDQHAAEHHASGIKGLVGKLRRHSLGFSPKASHSDHDSHGTNTPRKIHPPRAAGSTRSLVTKSMARDSALSLELWNAAYDALRDDPGTAGLVLAYESIVSHELPEHLKTDGMNMSFRGRSDEERLHLLTAITSAGLHKRRGSHTSQSDDLARPVIETAKNAIDPQMNSYSSTAVAWAGICTMTPLLLDPILRLEHLRVGILHVLGRVAWYMSLTRTLLPASWDSEETFRSQQHDLRDNISKQYRRVLEFEMNCVCASASGWNPAAKNVVSWNALANMVSNIQDADDALLKTVQASSLKQNLTQHYKDLELPNTRSDSGVALDDGIDPKDGAPLAP